MVSRYLADWCRHGLQKSRFPLIILLISFPIYALAQSGFAYWFSQILQNLKPSSSKMAVWLLGQGLLLVIFKFLAGFSIQWSVLQASFRFVVGLQEWFLESFLKLSGQIRYSLSAPELVARLSQLLLTLQDHINYRLIAVSRDAFVLVGLTLIASWKLPWFMTAILILTALILSLVLAYFNHNLQKTYQNMLHLNQKLNAYFISLFQRWEVVQIESTYPEEQKRIAHLSQQYRQAAFKSHIIRKMSFATSEWFAQNALLLVVFMPHNRGDWLTLGVFILAAYRPLKSLGQLILEWRPLLENWQQIKELFDRISLQLQQSQKILSKIGTRNSFPLLKSIDVSIDYPPFPSLRIPNMTLNPGEILWLSGRSGLGKSTILRILNGLLEATSGHIEIYGSSLYINQSPEWFEGTVEENLRYGGKSLSRDQLKKALSDLGLPHTDAWLEQEINEPISFSGGEQLRMSLVRSLSFDPNLLLLDEPFAQLDFIHRKKIESFIKDWVSDQETPRACIIASHIPTDLKPTYIWQLYRDENTQKTLVHILHTMGPTTSFKKT